MVDLQIIKLREVSQTEKQKSYITCMWNLKKNDTNELIYKAEIDIEKKLMVNKGGKGVRDKSGVRY